MFVTFFVSKPPLFDLFLVTKSPVFVTFFDKNGQSYGIKCNWLRYTVTAESLVGVRVQRFGYGVTVCFTFFYILLSKKIKLIYIIKKYYIYRNLYTCKRSVPVEPQGIQTVTVWLRWLRYRRGNRLRDETKKKKYFLKRYRNYLIRIERLEEKLLLIDNQLLGIKSVGISDMPKGGQSLTKDDLLIKKEETEQRIQNLVDISRKVKHELYACIETLDDYRFAEVLENYFIDGYTLEEIAEMKNYSVQHVGYLYGKGLDRITIVNNDE